MNHIFKSFQKKCYSKAVLKELTRTARVQLYLEEASLYIHYPYCKKLCSYCAFVKYVPAKGKPWTLDDEVLENAMVREIQTAVRNSHVKRITSVYFGGGTPSLARPNLVQRVLEAVKDESKFEDKSEVTLEGNPSSLSPQKIKDFITAGVNRFSIGVQSFREIELKSLHRDHNVKQAIECIETAKKLLPGRVSLDLLFARPYHTLQQWENELDTAIRISDDHIALYQLTLEPGTPLFKQVKSGSIEMPHSDDQAAMYELAVSKLTASGLQRYEVANFARHPKSESQHNRNYWRAGQYIGIGPGAHSRIVPNYIDTKKWNEDNDNKNNSTLREEVINAPYPRHWLNLVNKKGTSYAKLVHQNRIDILSEYLMAGLRTTDGVNTARWNTFHNYCDMQNLFHDPLISRYFDSEFLLMTKDSLKPTAAGMNVIDSIVPDLLNLIKNK